MTPEPPSPLTSELLGPDPIAAFSAWFREARDRSRVAFPSALCLSTVDEEGWPQGRIVLLKGVDALGFTFYTNYRSPKGRALDRHARAALTFYWDDLGRQVRVQGPVERVASEDSDRYFASRPRGSQLGAWASAQSAPVESREALEAGFREFEARFRDRDVPRPPHWGGYRVRPREVEFWQEAPNRLHDRIRYRKRPGGDWERDRLSP